MNANLNTNLAGVVGRTLWLEQLKAMGLTVGLAVVATAVLALAIKAALGLRPSTDAEEQGLDGTDHGENGYHPEEGGYHDAEESVSTGVPAPALVNISS